jgi:hypothetical protein
MRLYDIVNQLKVVLPRYTNRFSTTCGIVSIDVTNNIGIVITTEPHGLLDGHEITLSNFSLKNIIEDVSQDGLVTTFTTSIAHDLTEGWHPEIILGDFDDDDWNNPFPLLSVPNRKTFKIRSTNSEPILNTTNYILENRIDGINGTYQVTVIDSTSLSIVCDTIDGTYSAGSFNSDVRVTGSVEIDHFMRKYSEQNINSYWLCVVMHDAEVSKDRNTYTDAVANPSLGADMRLTLIDGFSIYVIGNSSKELLGENIIDVCRHELLKPILKCVYGMVFSSGLSTDSDFRTILTGHKTYGYDRARYIHQYSFEMSMHLSEEDTVEREDTRAYRNTEITMYPNDSVDYMFVNVDHDDEPLSY